MVEGRFVDVGQHQLVGFGDKEIGVEVFAVDEGRQPPRVHLILRDGSVFVPRVPHAVALVGDWRRDMIVGLDRGVIMDRLYFEVNVLDRHS
ncbi:MAG: hypothetical protein ND866_18310 [Pyrinomonadaceae bacterium]|nr:hypothetical protein [Pyrinomonadaceae bacterium]